MPVTSIAIRNYRAFVDSGTLELGPINVLIGPNNGGKSSLISALYLMQVGSDSNNRDVRVGSGNPQAEIDVGFVDVPETRQWRPDAAEVSVTMRLWPGGFEIGLGENARGNQLPQEQPNHFIVPYLSRRKVGAYDPAVNRRAAQIVEANFQHLGAKLAQLGNPSFPGHDRYSNACREILGFVVTAIPSDTGQEPGVFVSRNEAIPLARMGEGVPNIVGLLVDLTLYESKLFLMEEIENDLHPRALKALLRLILESSEESHNQFVVSTHSNIVARYLGSAPSSKLFYVATDRAIPPLASIHEVGHDPNERMAVLRDLGYELNDFNLWDGWIFLEESSAERIIRDHLIPWFAPGLVQRVRTLSSDGNSQVEPTFDDFYRLVRFTHLEPSYRGRAWVLIDGDEYGQGVVARLQAKYGSSWDASRFRTFSDRDFEAYYPDRFEEARARALSERDRQARREQKHVLLEQVREWIAANPDQAKAEFESSAAEVIQILQTIESELFGDE